MSLVLLSEMKAQVAITSVADDARLASCLAAAEAAVKVYCNNTFEASSVVEYLDGSGYPEQVLRNPPINTVSEVRLDTQGGYGQVAGSFDSTTVLTQGQDYFTDLARGKLLLWRIPSSVLSAFPVWGTGPNVLWGAGLTGYGAKPACWPKIPGCLKVTATKGYAAGLAPADLKAAIIQLAVHLRDIQETGGLTYTSVSYIDVSVGSQLLVEQLGNVTLPALGNARQMLAPYKEMLIPGGWL
jgi:hypothetical protein